MVIEDKNKYKENRTFLNSRLIILTPNDSGPEGSSFFV